MRPFLPFDVEARESGAERGRAADNHGTVADPDTSVGPERADPEGVANRVFKDKTTITRLVADIESSGIIERQPDREDKRERSVFLTEKGKEIMNSATMLIQRVDACAEAGIDEKDLLVCKTVLRRLHRNLTDSSL